MVQWLLYPMDNGNVQILRQQKMGSWHNVFFFSPPPHHAGHQNRGLVHIRCALYLWATSSALEQRLDIIVHLTHYSPEQLCLPLPKMGHTPNSC